MKFESIKYKDYIQIVFFLLMATTVPLLASLLIAYISPL